MKGVESWIYIFLPLTGKSLDGRVFPCRIKRTSGEIEVIKDKVIWFEQTLEDSEESSVTELNYNG